MTIYTPTDLYAHDSTWLSNTLQTDGYTTGFSFHAPGVSTPLDVMRDEGFITGAIVKKYYTPEQAAILYAGSFSIAYSGGTLTVNGIEYKIRVEGITSGDLTTSLNVYGPGTAPCTILQTMSDEGFVTGIPEWFGQADSGLTDFECTDGRCYGSGCYAPTIHKLSVTTSGGGDDEQTQSWTLPALKYDAVLMMVMTAHDFDSLGSPNPNRCYHISRVYVDGTEQGAPRMGRSDITGDGVYGAYEDPSWIYNSVGFVNVTALDTPTILLKARKEAMSGNYTCDLFVVILKAACA